MHNRRTIVSQAIVIKQGSDKKLCYIQNRQRFQMQCGRQLWKHILPERTVIHLWLDFFPTSAYLAISPILRDQSLSSHLNFKNLNSPSLLFTILFYNIFGRIIPFVLKFCSLFAVCKLHWCPEPRPRNEFSLQFASSLSLIIFSNHFFSPILCALVGEKKEEKLPPPQMTILNTAS